MPRTRHRMAQDGATALLIVDMINPLDFPGGPAMLPRAVAAASRIARLKQRMKADDAIEIDEDENLSQFLLVE